jgi:PAS domain S-box-containing protein
MGDAERGADGHSSVHVALAMRPGRDRDLLQDWLSAFPEYRVSATTTPAGADCDLRLIDRATWRDHEGRLRDLKTAADPVFLPHVLLLDGGGEERWTAVDIEAIDDVISLPVERSVLHRRIENLLRARRASLRLREREEQYEQLVELTPEGILILIDDEIRYANRAAGDLLGVEDADALLGRPIGGYVAPADEARLRALFDDGDADAQSREFVDVRFETAAGTTVETAVAGVGVTYGGDSAVQLIVRDRTEERRRQQRLDLFGRAVEAASQGITIADADQDDVPLVYANEAFERITGYDTAEVVGRNCRFLQGERTDERTVARLREAIDAERPVSVEILNYRKDGTPFWNQLDIVPVADGDGVTHFLGLQRDVTERKEREERLAVLNRVLRHNLRNRLNVVQGYAERLRETVDDADERAAAENVLDAVEELLAISDKAQRFRRVVSSDRRSLTVHDLAALSDRAAERFRLEHPDARVRTALPDRATARGNETLPLAVDELLELAAQSADTPPDLDVRVADEGDWITIEVVDRGGTIPAADLTVLTGNAETPTDHPQGVGGWLLRWVVLYSRGEVSVDRTDDPTIRLRFRPA